MIQITVGSRSATLTIASDDAARAWLVEYDPEGVAFDY